MKLCHLAPLTPSLIDRSGSSSFRLSTTAVSMSLAGSRFSSELAPRPLYGAFLVKKFIQSGASGQRIDQCVSAGRLSAFKAEA